MLKCQKVSSDEKLFWVVVADESKAIVYGRDSLSGPLRELFSLDNEVARKKMDELISDSGGRSFDSHGKGRHTMSGEQSDPQKVAAMAFAKQIAERIAQDDARRELPRLRAGSRATVPGRTSQSRSCRDACRALRNRR